MPGPSIPGYIQATPFQNRKIFLVSRIADVVYYTAVYKKEKPPVSGRPLSAGRD